MGSSTRILRFSGRALRLSSVVVILLLCVPSNLLRPVSADQPFDQIADWNFTIHSDLRAVDVSVVETIYPPYGSTWVAYSFKFFNNTSGFVAHDLETGKALQTGITSNARWTNVTVRFDSPKKSGYKFKLEFQLVNTIGETENHASSMNSYHLDWNWGGTDKPLPQNVTILLPEGYDLAWMDGVNDWWRDISGGRVRIAFNGSAPPKGYFSWQVHFQQGTSVTVPMAVVIPKIDGRYTPLDDLRPEDNNDSSWKKEVTNEWDDAVEVKLTPFFQPFNPSSKPEWYLRLKHDKQFLYILYDGVSDHQIGSTFEFEGRTVNTRQDVDIYFDTVNGPHPAGPKVMAGVSHLGLYFDFPNTLRFGWRLGWIEALGEPPSEVPFSSCSYQWSLGESPHSTTPHLIIEIAVDLSVLTEHSRMIGVSFYGGDIELNALLYGNHFDLGGTQTIPQLRQSAFDSLNEANASIQRAVTGGRIEGLDESRSLLENAQAAYVNEAYDSAVDLADQAKKLADAATYPQDYYLAKQLLVNATTLRSSLLSSNLTSPEAQNQESRGLIAYDSAEKAFSSNDFAATIRYAENATVSFKQAFAAEQSYRDTLARLQAENRQKQQQQFIYLVGVGGSILIAAVAAILIRKKRAAKRERLRNEHN